ncbi:MAG TPA: glycerol-3-phosphate 1-O-acyltransferase PlsY [Novosphingobium sp.]|nr:glycerol-3-phosphate 1-O-acyltransferase PlsY [Novosphingobium sp.]HZV10500.1 glycerol-3-phosphate 1-O-acyltransferase PlsY [Novosphingobium sp.]
MEAGVLAGLAGGYALGSVPFGLLLTRAAGAGDIRAIGSGNIGATNVLRTGRKGLAAATLLLDMLKGLAAVLLARALWGEQAGLAAAAGAMVGHCFPVWLRFRGGKGVATMLGVSAGLGWAIGLVAALAWLGCFRLSRISSVGGMGAALAAPIAAVALGEWGKAPLLAALALLVVAKHHANIARLIAGEEPRVGRKG